MVGTNSDILFSCDKCGKEFVRNSKNYNSIFRNFYYDKDYCCKCWRKLLNNRSEYKTQMSKSIRKMYEERPEICDKKRKSMLGKNEGNKNGMKQIGPRKRVSKAMKERMSNKKEREKCSENMSRCWKEGKYDNVPVGRCKWHSYQHSNGKIYKVQGTWEFAFIQWLDQNDMNFKCHEGSLKYFLNNKQHYYLPDFWVEDWNSYVDIKCKYFYEKGKFDAIRKYNPFVKLKILFEKDLSELGVDVWRQQQKLLE